MLWYNTCQEGADEDKGHLRNVFYRNVVELASKFIIYFCFKNKIYLLNAKMLKGWVQHLYLGYHSHKMQHKVECVEKTALFCLEAKSGGTKLDQNGNIR